jgi:histone H1/5
MLSIFNDVISTSPSKYKLLFSLSLSMEATSTKKKVQAAKPVLHEHPKYSEMIKQALTALKERGGSSRQAVLKYIMANFKVGRDEASVNTHLKMALKAGVKNSTLKQSKGTGATGSFRLGAVEKKQKKVQEKTKSAGPKKAKAAPAKSGEPTKSVKKAAPVKAKKSGGRATPKSPKKVVKKAAKKQTVAKSAPKTKPPPSAKRPSSSTKVAKPKKTAKAGKQ